MEFIVFDNISTFNKKVPFNGNPNTRVPITEVCLTETGAFWFSTEMKLEVRTINVNARYVHIHPGIIAFNAAQFNKTPLIVNKSMMKYNPDTKCVEVKKWVFKKPIWEKKVIYYGLGIPSRKISCLGSWFFNYHLDSIILILDYFPQKDNFKFKNETVLTEAEQKKQIQQLQVDLNKLKIESSSTLEL